MLDEAVAAGTGVIWRCRTRATGTPPGPGWSTTAARFTTVAERLKPEALYDRFVAFREGLGMEIVPLTGGDRPPLGRAGRAAAGRRRSSACSADRDLSARGVEVTFFGGRTRMPAGPALLALRTGAAAAAGRRCGTTPGRLGGADPPGRSGCPAERLRRPGHAGSPRRSPTAFAAGIAAHPQDWHMLQRLWLADLDPARRPSGAG